MVFFFVGQHLSFFIAASWKKDTIFGTAQTNIRFFFESEIFAVFNWSIHIPQLLTQQKNWTLLKVIE